MDPHESAALKLFLVVFLVNTSMMERSTADSMNVTTATAYSKPCNESRLQWEVEVCGDDFKRDMDHVDPQQLCNFTHFMSEYYLFTVCTESKSKHVNCYWPNPLVESYIIRMHKHFFSNCTHKQVEWADPPDNLLTILILIPVFLTLAMIALVVWCSKRNDLLA